MLNNTTPTPHSVLEQIKAIRTGVWFTDLANIAALLFETLPNINWAGFYLNYEGKLWLGPFQGKSACTYIDLGRGVCGKSALERTTLVVPDVHAFEGHIACDSRSRSEIVVPLVLGSRLFGVLDVDSPDLNRFGSEDQALLEAVASVVSEILQNSSFG
jgi:L-methionine (R)-S-oxide reductase